MLFEYLRATTALAMWLLSKPTDEYRGKCFFFVAYAMLYRVTSVSLFPDISRVLKSSGLTGLPYITRDIANLAGTLSTGASVRNHIIDSIHAAVAFKYPSLQC